MENLYSITYKNENGETVTTETAAAFYITENGVTKNGVFQYATETAAALGLKAYTLPCNPVLLALHCAKKAASVAANKGGKASETKHNNGEKTPTDKAAAAKAAAKARRQAANATQNKTQDTIDNDLRRISAATAAALASDTSATAASIENYVFSLVAAANAHTQDFFSVCMLAALENENATPTDKAAAIYKAANAWTYQNKTARRKEVSTEYIIDGGGDLVAFGTAAAAILKGGEKWTPTAAANMDTETAAALGNVLAAAFAMLTPTQRLVVAHIVEGHSQRKTAAALKRSIGTIGKHIAIIRKVYADYITANAPQFCELVKQAETAAAAKATAKRDRTAAERMKRYRERKAAAKAAAI